MKKMTKEMILNKAKEVNIKFIRLRLDLPIFWECPRM